MYPSYVVPTMQASVLCEDVRQEINGANTLIGAINVIPAVNLPIGLLKLCLWTRWCSGIGKFRQHSRLVGPDEESTLAEAAVQFELQSIEAHATNVHFFAGVQFHNFGVHHVEVTLDDRLVIRFPVAVLKVNPAEQQQAPVE
jgi:hypothetical protein